MAMHVNARGISLATVCGTDQTAGCQGGIRRNRFNHPALMIIRAMGISTATAMSMDGTLCSSRQIRGEMGTITLSHVCNGGLVCLSIIFPIFSLSV